MTQIEFNLEVVRILKTILAHLPPDSSNNRGDLWLRVENLYHDVDAMVDKEPP